jgi:hypothetical protein
MAKRNSEHIGFVSLSRQPATADWTVATIKLAMEQEPEGDIEAVLNYVPCKAKHRFGVRLRVTRASPGRPPIDDTEVVNAILKWMDGGTARSIAVRMEKIGRGADDMAAKRWDDKAVK